MEEKKLYAVFMTTYLTDIWLKDSIRESIDDVAAYVRENLAKLKRVAGRDGDWNVYHYEPGTGKCLEELTLSDEEYDRFLALIRHGKEDE